MKAPNLKLLMLLQNPLNIYQYQYGGHRSRMNLNIFLIFWYIFSTTEIRTLAM